MKHPVCDVDPVHGPMQAEPLYHLDGTVNKERGEFWFCQVKDCDGYGGPVRKEKPQPKKNEQLEMKL